MTKPNWSLVDIVRVGAKPEGYWTLAIEFIPGPRLLRFRASEQDKDKKPVGKKWIVNDVGGEILECGPDGVLSGDAKSSYACPGAPLGALIGKLGGSSADIPEPSPSTTPFGTKKVFAVGAQCIISISAADSGPLYLTMNDEVRSFQKHSGELHVAIWEAPA